MGRLPSSLNGFHCENVIIGAGMSGLAAGIRLALFGRESVILERHNAPGGLNSFYSIDGRKYDVGLHAFTNFVGPKQRRATLNRILRQLRLSGDAFGLAPQSWSAIRFPELELRFDNDFATFEAAIAERFPAGIDAFKRLVAEIDRITAAFPQQPEGTARAFLRAFITDAKLREALAIGPFFYANPCEDDMPLGLFALLFQAIFQEGLARPYEGVRRIIRSLLDHYRELGGLRKMKCGVQQLIDEGNCVRLLLDNGEEMTADRVLSSAGGPETFSMLGGTVPAANAPDVGQISLAETITVFDRQPRDFGWEETIVFFCDEPELTFRRPDGLVDLRSGVIAIPNNYRYEDGQTLAEGQLRVSVLANFEAWAALGEDAYAERKQELFAKLQGAGTKFLPAVDAATWESAVVAHDMFTPKTIRRYTGRMGGAVYGSPDKANDGRTPSDRVFLIGADQGNIGITGALMSGITMANAHALE